MYTVLIADDETIELNYLKSVFKKHSEEFTLIDEAHNGEQVIAIAMHKKPNIIIMDINMPLYNGLTAAQRIKTEYHNTIIILNSAYSEFEFARQAIHYNLDAYLLKPASEREILDTINSCVHKRCLKSNISGDYYNLSNTLNNEYPYTLLDNLIDSIFIKDFELIRFNSFSYLDFLKSQKHNLEEYRLHIINTIFSIMRAIKKILPENSQALLNSAHHLQKISKSHYWYDILTLTEDFFRQLLYLFSDNSSFSPNCADMVAKYIDENFHEQISLHILADMFHFNPTYLSRVFHNSKGLTINTYLRGKRINHAIYLIENSSLSIKDVSVSCGYTNVSHFNRVFKQVTGKAPTEIKVGGGKRNGY